MKKELYQMKIFLIVFVLALFMREILAMFRAERTDKPAWLLWHFCWGTGIIFLAYFLGKLLDMI